MPRYEGRKEGERDRGCGYKVKTNKARSRQDGKGKDSTAEFAECSMS